MKASPSVLAATAVRDERGLCGLTRARLNMVAPSWLSAGKQFLGRTTFVRRPARLMICFLALAGLSIGLSPARADTAKGVPLSPTQTDPSTSFLAVQVGSNGRFNMGANPGLSDCAFSAPFTIPCQYNLMYDWPGSPGTSFTSIRIDGTDFEYGETSFVTPPTESADGLENTSVADFPNSASPQIQVLQELSIIQGVSGNPDTARIRYVVTNVDTQPHDVGVRVMLDTMLNNNDGAPFRVNGAAISNETDFVGDAVPNFFDVFYNLDVPGISARGTLRGAGATTPDRFVISSWPDIEGTVYDFTVNTNQLVTSDSAVGIYWNPITLAPGEQRVLITYYGVSSGLGGGGLVVVAPQALDTVPGDTAGSVVWSPNPFPIDIFFSNNSSNQVSVCPNIEVTGANVNLITPAPGNCPSQVIQVGAGDTIQTQLLVTATQAGDAHYLVQMLQSDGSAVATQGVETLLPELVVPSTTNPLNPGTIPLHADGVFCADTSNPCTNGFAGNTGGVPHRPFEWDGITPLAFKAGVASATPTLLNDSNLDVLVYSAVDSNNDAGQLSFFLMYDFPHRTTPFGTNDHPTVTFDVAGGRFAGRMVVTLDCSTGNLLVDGFDNGVAFSGRSGSDLGLQGGCGFGKSPNPSGDAAFDTLLNTDHAMFELMVPLTENLGGGVNPAGVYDPSVAFWSASAPGDLPTTSADTPSGQLVLSDNTVSINITNGASTVAPLTETTPTGSNDLAIVKLTVPKTITLKSGGSVTKKVIVQIQNRGLNSITVSNLTTLANLVTVTLSAVGTNASCTAPTAVLISGVPNVVPKTIKSKGSLNVAFNVTYTCAVDPLKGTGHEDFSYVAHVNTAALDGNADFNTADDDCPRAALPGGVDNTFGLKIKDKGCGGKTVGSPVLTDVVVK